MFRADNFCKQLCNVQNNNDSDRIFCTSRSIHSILKKTNIFIPFEICKFMTWKKKENLIRIKFFISNSVRRKCEFPYSMFDTANNHNLLLNFWELTESDTFYWSWCFHSKSGFSSSLIMFDGLTIFWIYYLKMFTEKWKIKIKVSGSEYGKR